MKVIILTRPQKLKSKERFVEIYDANKELFYSHTPKNKVFNLPAGVFYSNNNLKIAGAPLLFKAMKLPRADNYCKIAKGDFIATFGNNPNKATIFLDEGKIFIDRKYYESLDTTGKTFVMQHELGHRHFKSETAADAYAFNKLLEMGFNPSQIVKYIDNNLSNTAANQIRCDLIFQNSVNNG